MVEREEERMGQVKEGREAAAAEVEAAGALARALLFAGRLARAVPAALIAAFGWAVSAPATALAQDQGGGFDPQGMVRGFGEDIGWVILLLVLVGLAKAVWDRNVVTGIVVILVGGFFATLAMGPDAILDAGQYITGRAGLGGGGGG